MLQSKLLASVSAACCAICTSSASSSHAASTATFAQKPAQTVAGQAIPEGVRQVKLTDHFSTMSAQDYNRMLAG
jgi:hypothetical protein